jgi:hypothetical protein
MVSCALQLGCRASRRDVTLTLFGHLIFQQLRLKSTIEVDMSSAIFRTSQLLSQYIGGKPIFWMRDR